MRRSILYQAAAAFFCLLPVTSYATSTIKKTPAKKTSTKKTAAPGRHVANLNTLHLPIDDFPADATVPELPTETRQGLADTGAAFLGKGLSAFTVGADKFTGDCIGFVEAVYHTEGIPFRDVLDMSATDGGSAVRAAYRGVKQYGILFRDQLSPEPGDLIFWDNTFDFDRDGRFDDPLTHIGMVYEVLSDGTVKFVHRGGKGVAFGYMNLSHPDDGRSETGEVINSQLRYSSKHDGAQVKRLSLQLFVAFGRFDPEKLGPALQNKPRVDFAAVGGGAW